MRRVAKPHFARQQTTKTPSCRFPLRAGGTEWARGWVPLAKRGEPQGGGLVWKCVWVLVVVSCWLQATAQPADLAQDPLLQKRITVRYLFAIEYREPYALPPAEPAQKTDTEDSEKP